MYMPTSISLVLRLGATHYYYFGGTPYFSGLNDTDGSQTEVQTLGYDFGTLTPFNLYLNWYTMVAGNDVNLVGKRAYSSLCGDRLYLQFPA